MNTEKKNTVAAMSVMFARKMIESARTNGVEEVDGKKVVTVNDNKFYVWTEEFTRKDGKVMNRPHIEDSEGKDISKKFKVRADLYAIVKACVKGKTETARKKKPMNKELYESIIKDMDANKSSWKVEEGVVSKNIDGIGLVEILGETYEQKGKTMLNRMVKVDGEVKIGGMNARNLYLRAQTMIKKSNAKSKAEVEKENEDYFGDIMGKTEGSVKVLSESAV